MFDIFERIEEDFSLLDRRAVGALLYTAAGMASIFYLKDQNAVAGLLTGTDLEPLGRAITDTSVNNLAALAWWVGVVTVFYFLVPAAIIKLVWKKNLADFGLSFRVENGFWKLLAVCLGVMLPLVYWMSTTAGFAAKYPFFRVYDGGTYLTRAFLAWELIYFVQFFGLEFFFRGFLVHSLKPALGVYAIFAMTVPYCMIHFGKPPAETFAAIVAGVFLGWLSYRNGNIWLGLALHCAVAFSMDILALFNKGLLGF
jgi:membrane protease YdiL (CAAX protease family)